MDCNQPAIGSLGVTRWLRCRLLPMIREWLRQRFFVCEWLAAAQAVPALVCRGQFHSRAGAQPGDSIEQKPAGKQVDAYDTGIEVYRHPHSSGRKSCRTPSTGEPCRFCGRNGHGKWRKQPLREKKLHNLGWRKVGRVHQYVVSYPQGDYDLFSREGLGFKKTLELGNSRD